MQIESIQYVPGGFVVVPYTRPATLEAWVLAKQGKWPPSNGNGGIVPPWLRDPITLPVEPNGADR